jgi:hypothetical protein
MKLVLVHGRRQQGKNPAALKASWLEALDKGLADARLPPRPAALRVEFPFYGDKLSQLLDQLKGERASTVIQKGGTLDAQTAPSPFVAAYLDQIRRKAGITDQEVRAELAQEVIERGPQNWEWVQGLARVLSRKSPAIGSWVLSFLEDVEAYLTNFPIKDAVNDIVSAKLDQTPTVLVGHSLGTIVCYEVLQRIAKSTPTPLFLTIGSPLGIDVVKNHIYQPRGRPAQVTRWVNATDERDEVALFARLDRTTFAAGIENLSDIQNPKDDPHAATGYLADIEVARCIGQAIGTT